MTVRSITVHCSKCRKPHSVKAEEVYGTIALAPSHCPTCGEPLSISRKLAEEIQRESLRFTKRD